MGFFHLTRLVQLCDSPVIDYAVQLIVRLLVVLLLPFKLYAQPSLPQWVHRWDGGMNRDDVADGILVSMHGVVYTAGTTYVPDSLFGFAQHATLVKNDSTGALIWKRVLELPGFESTGWMGVAEDAAGNVYTVGYYQVGNNPGDLLLAKYAPTGTKLWHTLYSDPNGGGEYGHRLALDGAGNIYVSGARDPLLSDRDFLALKYDTAGTLLWARTYNFTVSSGSVDVVADMAIDPANAVILTGHTFHTGQADMLTVKWDSSGALQWDKIYSAYNGNAGARAVTTDALGNVYVAGTASDGVAAYTTDLLAVRYSAAGIQGWVQSVGSASTASSYEEATGIHVDATGRVLMTGHVVTPAGDLAFAAARYTTNGVLLWSKTYNPTVAVHDRATQLAANNDGSFYLVGFSGDDYITASTDVVAAKFDSLGTLMWEGRYAGPPGKGDLPAGCMATPGGMLYVCGHSRDNPNNQAEWLTMRFATPALTGTGISSALHHEAPAALQISPNPAHGRVVIRYAVAQKGPAWLTICNATGQALWQHSTGDLNPGQYSAIWETGGLPAGVYFCTLRTAAGPHTMRLVAGHR